MGKEADVWGVLTTCPSTNDEGAFPAHTLCWPRSRSHAEFLHTFFAFVGQFVKIKYLLSIWNITSGGTHCEFNKKGRYTHLRNVWIICINVHIRHVLHAKYLSRTHTHLLLLCEWIVLNWNVNHLHLTRCGVSIILMCNPIKSYLYSSSCYVWRNFKLF